MKTNPSSETGKKPVYLAHKIDCEATQPAIRDADLGRRALEGYAEVLEKIGRAHV